MTGEQPDPCRRWSAYATVQGRQRGLELEWRRRPAYLEVRLVGIRRTRVATFHSHQGGRA